MVNRKDRRHDGRYTPGTTLSMPRSEMIEQCLEPRESYDSWNEWRDGIRFPSDPTKIRPMYFCWCHQEDIERTNAKQRKLLIIRKAMRSGRKFYI